MSEYTIKPSTILALAGMRHAQRDRALAEYIKQYGHRPHLRDKWKHDTNGKDSWMAAFDKTVAVLELRNGDVTRHTVRIDILAAWAKTFQTGKREPEIALELVNGNMVRVKHGQSEATLKAGDNNLTPWIGDALVLDAPANGGEFKARGATQAKDMARAAADYRRKVESVEDKIARLKKWRDEFSGWAARVRECREMVASANMEAERERVRSARRVPLTKQWTGRIGRDDNYQNRRADRISHRRGVVRRWQWKMPIARAEYVALAREIRAALA